jgi:hypothetical protein
MAFNLYSRAGSWIAGFILFALLGSSFGPVAAQAPSMASQSRSSAGLQAPGSTPIPQLVGHISGLPESLAIQGGLAALVYWRGFELLDVSHPEAPRQIAFLPLTHHPIDVVLDQDYAYLSYVECGDSLDVNGCKRGLLIIDIADPTAPRVVSDYPTTESMYTMAVKDGILLGGDYSLFMIDISNPEAPHEIAKVESISASADIQFYTQPGSLGSRLAYVTSGRNVTVVDISNRGQPVVRGVYSSQGSLRDAALYLDDSNGEEKPFLYLAVGHSDEWDLAYAGLVVVDVSDPDNLKEVAVLDAGKDFIQAATYGHMLYTATDQGIAIFDLSNPASPQPSGVYSATQSVWKLAQANHYLYVADAQAGLQILSLADPANPVQAGSRDELPSGGKTSLVGHTAYVPSGNGLEIWDLFNPVEPRRLGSFDIPGGMRAVVSGDYALVSDGYSQTWLLDVSNPVTPVETARLNLIALSLAMTGTLGATSPAFAYIGTAICDPAGSDCDSSLAVVDLSQPVTPTIVQRLAVQGQPKAILLSGPRAFVANGASPSSFLAVYDTSAGTLEPLAVSAPFSNFAEDLALCGQYVCVATWSGLSILDLSDLAAIHEIGRYTYAPPAYAPSGISSLAIDGPIVYLTDLYNGLLVVIDLSDPTRPQELARLQTPGFGEGLTLSDGYLYATNGMGGFSIYQTAASAGQVHDVNGRPFSGVTIHSNLQPVGASGMNGGFTLDAQSNQALTLVPQMAGYAFWPPKRAVTTSDALRGQDFTILASPASASLVPGITTTLRYTDTASLLTEFSLPAGAAPWADRMVASPPPGLTFAGHAFELAFQPAGSQTQEGILSAPISVTIAYNRANLRLVSDEQLLALYWWDGQGWVDAAETCQAPTLDLQKHVFHASLCRAGRYALLGPTWRKFLPLVSNLP